MIVRCQFCAKYMYDIKLQSTVHVTLFSANVTLFCKFPRSNANVVKVDLALNSPRLSQDLHMCKLCSMASFMFCSQFMEFVWIITVQTAITSIASWFWAYNKEITRCLSGVGRLHASVEHHFQSSSETVGPVKTELWRVSCGKGSGVSKVCIYYSDHQDGRHIDR